MKFTSRERNLNALTIDISSARSLSFFQLLKGGLYRLRRIASSEGRLLNKGLYGHSSINGEVSEYLHLRRSSKSLTEQRLGHINCTSQVAISDQFIQEVQEAHCRYRRLASTRLWQTICRNDWSI